MVIQTLSMHIVIICMYSFPHLVSAVLLIVILSFWPSFINTQEDYYYEFSVWKLQTPAFPGVDVHCKKTTTIQTWLDDCNPCTHDGFIKTEQVSSWKKKASGPSLTVFLIHITNNITFTGPQASLGRESGHCAHIQHYSESRCHVRHCCLLVMTGCFQIFVTPFHSFR